MPPSVRIEAKAWDDPAFAVLAMRLGWDDPDFAMVKCARIWAHATEQNDPEIRIAEADAIARSPGFSAHMVAARLADVSETDPGAIVLRGATGKHRKRISWLATKRKNARKGGAATKAKGGPIGVRSAVPKGSPLTPALTPALTTSRSEGEPAQPALILTPTSQSGESRAAGIWRTFNTVRRASIPGAREIPATPKLLARIAALLTTYHAEDVEAVIAYLGERCREDVTQRQWFDAVTPFRDENFARTLSKVGTSPPRASAPTYNGRG